MSRLDRTTLCACLPLLLAIVAVGHAQHVGILGHGVPAVSTVSTIASGVGSATGAGSASGTGGVTSPAALLLSDLTLVGAFNMPTGDSGDNNSYGLTYKYIATVRHFFYVRFTGGTHLVRASDPGTTASSPYPTATFENDYGVFAQNRDIINDNDCETVPGTPPHVIPCGQIQSVHVDQSTGNLWWNYADVYDSCCTGPDASFGYSTMNDAAHTVTDVGFWGLSGLTLKYFNTGLTDIPAWFLTKYGISSTQRMAAGMGGYQSIVANGPASLGPVLSTFSPTSLPANGSLLSNTPLIYYPYNGTPNTSPLLGRIADQNYIDFADGWNPSGGTGFWQWGASGNDTAGGSMSCAWVDTDLVSGPICATIAAEGNVNTTILASPAPTTTSATLNNAGNLRVGDHLFIATPSGFGANSLEPNSYVTSVSGNAVQFTATVSTPTSGGVARSAIDYINSNIEIGRGQPYLQAYAPADLGAVAQGSVQPYNVIPHDQASWSPDIDTYTGTNNYAYFSGTYPLAGWEGVPFYRISGVVFDSTASQLLIAVSNASKPNTSVSNWRQRVYVWSVRH
jgi:hypothetical protein